MIIFFFFKKDKSIGLSRYKEMSLPKDTVQGRSPGDDAYKITSAKHLETIYLFLAAVIRWYLRELATLRGRAGD